MPKDSAGDARMPVSSGFRPHGIRVSNGIPLRGPASGVEGTRRPTRLRANKQARFSPGNSLVLVASHSVLPEKSEFLASGLVRIRRIPLHNVEMRHLQAAPEQIRLVRRGGLEQDGTRSPERGCGTADGHFQSHPLSA